MPPHCSGRNNPADIPSCGLGPLELSVDVCGWMGQTGYKKPMVGKTWELQPPAECLAEMSTKDWELVHAPLTTGHSTDLSDILNCKDYGSSDRLLSITALVSRFCQKLKSKINPEIAAALFDEDAKAEEL